MIAVLLSVVKYWKQAVAGLLGLVFLMSLYRAHSRGEALQDLRWDYATLAATHQASLKTVETLKKKDTDRDEFEKAQQKSFRASDFSAAYERLRDRQSSSSAR